MNTTPICTTIPELLPMLLKLRSAKVATIVAITAVRLNKRDTATKSIANPYGEIRKVQTIRVKVNDDYEGNVNDARDAEGKVDDFEVAPLQWGEHASNAVITHGGEQYLQTIVLESDPNPTYIDSEGNPVAYEAIRPYFPPYRPNARQELDSEVKVRTWKLTSLYDMWMDDKHIYKASGIVGPRQD